MTTSSVPTGLRERKKARTRAAIREHAMRLFYEQGYAATTIDQIAAAADVSQSTFFRYFPTKEDTVLSDDIDPLLVAALRAQPLDLHPVEAIRRSMVEIFKSISDTDWKLEQRRQQLFLEVPELRARAMQQLTDTIAMLGQVVAERAGLPPDDFSSRVLAGAVIGASVAGAPAGMTTSYERGDLGRIDDALRLLQAGLPIGPA
jgi:AcrR family transcriptional regulator